jgi:ABC-type dipeptide/oligopeptide/nickel transport system permease component
MKGLTAYILRRLLFFIPTFFIVSLIVFSIVHFLPGDPITWMLVDNPLFVSEEVIEALTKYYGLDKPLYIQYFDWLIKLFQGNWGMSMRTRAPVLMEISSRYMNTIQLAVSAMIFSFIIGIIAGVTSAVKQYSWFDRFSMFGALLGAAMPVYWTGLLLIWLFAVQFRLFPVSGGTGLNALVLPTITLGLANTATMARLTRSSMLEVMREDYIKTARSKGLKERLVIYKHALKNALIPVVTVAGMSFGGMLGGTVITETIFTRPGLGRIAVESIWTHDLPMIQGTAIVYVIIFISLNLVVDIVYAYIDPRIRYG